jgi:DNA gyrase subunit A
VDRNLETEMHTSYIDYAMSVIVGRALPDARDGLKPVHRRILHAMNEMSLTSDKAYKKSARVVGEVLGKYHPHGDTSIYESLVRMAQEFSLRYPLVDGQGNFGSVDGDNAAAMRYTECRMTKIAGELLEDIESETVDFTDNFDASLKEPLVLPGKFPNLLANGSSGIAVGMATNIPPHNLGELVDGIIATVEKPATTFDELWAKVPGPDFPTGGIIQGRHGIKEAYATGRGIIRVRAKAQMEETKEGRARIIVTELPYQVNKATLLETIAELVKEKRIEDISDLRDESDRDGMRVVVELKRNAIPDVVLNQLFAHTQMEASFGILNLALVKNEPKVLTLRGLIDQYVEQRVEVVTRRTKYMLRKAEERSHILEGLTIALENIDAVIETIKQSRDPETAKAGLMGRFQLSSEQAKAILEMRLSKLTSLEVQGVKDELAQLKKDIQRYKEILGDRAEVLKIIIGELKELREKYADARRTAIVDTGGEIFIEDLIPDEVVVITTTGAGYIKRLTLDNYRSQNRGGKGLIGMETKDEDHVVDLFVTTTHKYILFFTNKGKVYWLKAYKIPEGSRYSKGKAIVNLLEGLEEGEKVQAAIPVDDFSEDRFVFFATRLGLVKKTELSAFGNVRVTGIRAINLEEGDELIGVGITDGTYDVVLAKAGGDSVRFHEEKVRPMGRTATGVYGAKLEPKDEVVSLALVKEKEKTELLTITENGYGKRTAITEYRTTNRGAYGVITIKTTDRNGKVVSVREVKPGDEIIATSEQGMVIRIPVDSISVQGRNTAGVIVMRMDEGDKVIAVARLGKEDIEEAAKLQKTGPPAPPTDIGPKTGEGTDTTMPNGNGAEKQGPTGEKD